MALMRLDGAAPTMWNEVCQPESGGFIPTPVRYVETQLNFEMLRIELAKGGRPKSFWERGLCWIAGVGENHYRTAEEAKKGFQERSVKKIGDLVIRNSLFGFINPIEEILLSLSKEPGFDWKYETEQFHQRLMKINSIKDRFDDSLFLVEWIRTDDSEGVHYQIPIYGDDSSTEKPIATLQITYNKADDNVTVETKITGRSLYLGIQLKALAMTLEIEGGITLDQPPSLDWNALSLQWRTNNHQELFQIFTFFEQMYEITFTNWGMFFSENCIFTHTWERSWFPTFISTMLQVDHIEDSLLKINYLRTANTLSKFCSTPCLDYEQLAMSVTNMALNDPSTGIRKIAFELIYESNDPKLLESIAYRAWNQRDEITPIDSINNLCNVLDYLETYEASVEITNGLLHHMLTVLQDEKADASSEDYFNMYWLTVDLSYRLKKFIHNGLPVDLAKATELANFWDRSKKKVAPRYLIDLRAALNS